MIKSPKFTHSKKDNNKAQGRSAHLTAIVVSLVLSIIMITISVFNVSAVVIDVSSHDGLIDWNCTIKCPDNANATEKHVAVMRPYSTAFRVPLSHSSNSFAPILQPVIIALACASAAPTGITPV